MTQPVIAAPAGFVPETAISFSTGGAAVQVGHENPLPTSEPAFRGAAAIAVGLDHAPGRGLAINCAAAGDVMVKFADQSLLAVPVQPGLTILPFAVSSIVADGTTANAVFATLI